MSGASQFALRTWEAASPHAVVVLSHSPEEPSGVHDYLARRLTQARYTLIAIDHRDVREPHGHAGLKSAVAALDHAVSSASQSHPGRGCFLLGHSSGAAAALAYAVAHQDRLSGLIFAAPLAQPPLGRLAGVFERASAALLPDIAPMHLDPQTPNPDARTFADILVNPLTQLGPIGASTAAERQRRAAVLMDGVDTIDLPVLLLWGIQEGLAPSGGAEHLLGALTHAEVTRHSFDSLYHDLLSGPERDHVLDTLVAWLDAQLA